MSKYKESFLNSKLQEFETVIYLGKAIANHSPVSALIT
jgi:hypothetical protein